MRPADDQIVGVHRQRFENTKYMKEFTGKDRCNG